MKYFASLLVTVLLTSTYLVQPLLAGGLADVAISNVSDTSFVVSWLTAISQTGHVQLEDGVTYDDIRGADFSGRTHYIVLTALQLNSEYSFDIVSGGTRYENAGAHWVVHTGAALAPRPPDVIFGRVKNPDGSSATSAIVLALIDRVQQGAPSAVLSKLITASDDGFFSINLAESRALEDPTRFYAYAVSSDRYMNNSVTLEAVSVAGTGLVTMEMADTRLRSDDPEQMLVIPLTADTETP